MDIGTVFTNINKMVERESKTSTYKFALLRAAIDTIQENSPYLEFAGQTVLLPMGLLMEKWLVYYYPLLESPRRIPQIHSSPRLAFESAILNLIQFYADKGGLSAFYSDLRHNRIPASFQPDFRSLLHVLHTTITKMPMKHLGQSLQGQHYAVFDPRPLRTPKPPAHIDYEAMVASYGMCAISQEYYQAFHVYGSFIHGRDSLLMKWAEFSEARSREPVSKAQVLGLLLESPVTERDASESKKIFREMMGSQEVRCVWTGQPTQHYEIDHVVAFSIWKNNDLWNLLPVLKTVNANKRDKVPTPELIESQKAYLLSYWERIEAKHPETFRKEIQTALLGNHAYPTWRHVAIAQLKSICHYLIHQRGFEAWTPKA